MSEDVDMRGAAEIVAWEEGGELGDTQGVGWLETAKGGGVDVRGVAGVAIT